MQPLVRLYAHFTEMLGAKISFKSLDELILGM